jgi:hypothetical protein
VNPFQLLSAIGFPLAMAIGGIAAWRLTKKEADRESKPAQWRDDSLDDWLKERDAKVEEKRLERLAQGDTSVASAEEQEVKVHQQRLGG